MKKRKLKAALCYAVSLVVLSSSMVMPAWAADESTWQSDIKDHWNFDTLMSDKGSQTAAEVVGDVHIVDSGDPIFGNVLRFGAGTDNYMRLDQYIDTGAKDSSFSMWYRYDTAIEGDTASASTVLLQAEGQGRSLLTLRSDGKYHTFINKQDAVGTTSVEKGNWQHITVTFNQTSNEVSFYVNGELDSTQSMGAEKASGIMPLRLGAHKNAGSTDPHPMRGDVDEFYAYERVLTAEEAKAIYADKATALYNSQLQALIKDAEEVYQSGTLPEDAEQAVLLKTALEEAKVANTLDQMKAAYDKLRKAKEAYRAELPLGLTLNLDNVTRKIDPNSIFGINHRYAFNGYGTFDPETMQMREEFTQLYKDAGFGSIRYPGGTISNLFNWKTTIGPKERRKKQIHGFYNYDNQVGIEPNFGLTEIADFASGVGSEIVYVYSLGRGNTQDAADLVEYLNAKVGTNPNGGIDWAAVRESNGHREPYNVRYFEIGNEMQQAYDADGNGSQGYWTTYVEGGHAKAYTNGGVAVFDKKYTVDEENWNKKASVSDGSPNLVRHLRYANLNPGMMVNGEIVPDPSFEAVNKAVQVFVGTDQNMEEWQVVENLDGSQPGDKHCVVNYSTGTITFGDGTHGMIPEAGKNIYASYTVNREGFIAISKAIKNTTDKINEIEGTSHEAKVYTSHESSEFINEMERLGANEWYDGMTIHPYSDPVSGGTDTAVFYDNAMKRAEEAGIKKVEHYVERMPADKVPVISEYGIFKNTERQLRSQTHAIYIAKVLMEYVRMGSPYIQKHCLSDWYSDGGDALGPTQQAVIQVVPQDGANTATGEGEFRFFSTPSAHVFKMLNTGFGENIVDSRLDKIPQMSNGVQSLSALASTDKDGNIYVALVNVDREKDQTVALHINNYDLNGRTMEIQRLESETVADENTLESPDKVSVTTEHITAKSDQTIRLKKHSFAVVKIINDVSTPDHPSPSPNPKPTPPLTPIVPSTPVPPTPVPPTPAPSFTDVPPTSWYADAVKYVSEHKLFEGVSENSFSPKTTMTRGMLATVLYRLAGMPHVEASGQFVDVAGQYYTDAVNWAATNDIVNGTGKGHFSPNANVTREQLAVILYRYASQQKYDVSQSHTLTGFADAAQISPFAQEAMQWANAVQLVNGTDENKLNPKGSATRAEVAAILMRFCEKYSA